MWIRHTLALADERNVPFTEQWHAQGFWWIFPLLMFLLCFTFMLRGCRSFWYRPEQHTKGRRDNQQGVGAECEMSPESALDILNKRYVRGEIDKDEYEEKSSVLVSVKVPTDRHSVIKPEADLASTKFLDLLCWDS